MKEFLRPILKPMVKNNFTYKYIGEPLYMIGAFFKRERIEYDSEPDYDAVDKLISKHQVLSGPFKGLKYPSSRAYGSAFYPKMVGSYEDHLTAPLEKAISMGLSNLVSVGTAEGYFTNGLAMRVPSLRVESYEIDPEARKFQAEMRDLNEVSSQVEIKELCSSQTLAEIKFDKLGLVICDCEGCEKVIFNEVNKNNLANWYIIIETHTMKDLTIPTVLKEHFKDSHKIVSLFSEDDVVKAAKFEIPEFSGFNLGTRKKLISEYRYNIQEWLILSPKNAEALV